METLNLTSFDMQGQTFNNSEAKEDVATTIERETN